MAKKKSDNPIKALWNKVPAYLRNRYFLTLLAFTAWMVFFDRHDVLTQLKLRSVLDRLQAEQSYFEAKIEEAEAERLDRQLNQERFARETYYMQRDNEDVFIIVPDEENN